MDLSSFLFDDNDGAGRAVGRLADRFGLSRDQTRGAVEKLTPELTGSLLENLQRPGGLEALTEALRRGDHSKYLQPERVDEDETTLDGNKILGHIFGSKQKSRDVASRASQETGVDTGILKKMLPIVASLVMGSMSKKANDAGALREERSGGGMVDVLGGLLGGGSKGGGLGGLLGGLGKMFG